MIKKTISPMLCSKAEPFDSNEWIFEKKLDGERTLFFIDKANNYFRIQNRDGFDKTDSYPEFRDIFSWINADSCVLDGEIVINGGKSADFHNETFKRRTHIQSSVRAEQLAKLSPLTYCVFDILFLNGVDMTQEKLLARKVILNQVIINSERIKVMPFMNGSGIALYETLLNNGYEGLVAKKMDSVYEIDKRSPNWIKVKPILKQTVKVIGYKETSGWGSFGGLITSFGDVALETEDKQKEYFRRTKNGEVMIEVRYQEMTPNNHFRFPKFNRFV